MRRITYVCLNLISILTIVCACAEPSSHHVELEVTENDGLKHETSTSITGASFFVIPEDSGETNGALSIMIGALGLFTVAFPHAPPQPTQKSKR